MPAVRRASAAPACCTVESSALRLDYKEVVDTMNGCRFPLQTGRLLKINRHQFDGFPIFHRLDTMSAE